ncbi:MAG: alpha-L-glutamate ligase-like protein [Micavibrio sp. TMED27]|nr:alpha-L-glutamate ligase-like protein [Micavibrio sp.]OUT91387.1 MAG: alpha-L-glutamate ligase-like protein [Micavibrio sp. TMED27]|tara:strand:+ start:627 stop:1508 length:882 start_codon:yes stop_codon:yes gene_type:complete
MLNIFKVHKALKRKGIVGINSRNLDFIFPLNDRKNYQFVDDKVLTKKAAIEAGIQTPQLYALIEYQEQLKRLQDILDHEAYNDFVIKPAKGSGGGGIMVISGRGSNGYIRPSGKVISLEEIRYHISNILGGLYSLGGVRDVAIIERRVKNIPLFEKLSYQGVPDIRLVVYKNETVMAMLRLPTRGSSGRANLHSGGIGVGLCLETGKTTNAILHNKKIVSHVDNNESLIGQQIPQWQEVLAIGKKASEISNLGYVGVDIVIDEEYGPMLLEINARPGISIQIANNIGLLQKIG